MWKITRGLVPNCGLRWETHGRRGLLVRLPPLSGSRMAIRTLREHSFGTEAPRLFNALPASLREHSGSLPTFKKALDELLMTVPDAPQSDSRSSLATTAEGLHSNSLRDWLRILARPSYARLLAETALGLSVSPALSLGAFPLPGATSSRRPMDTSQILTVPDSTVREGNISPPI